MTSQRKIEANRRNARKSTGPKTPEGKNASRFNAVTHGLTAQTIVLPHEDPAAYQQRLDDWMRDMKPRSSAEGYLVERAVRITWQLDRADFHERARLIRRLEQARSRRAGAADAETLLQTLLEIPKDDSSFGDLARTESHEGNPHPGVLLARIRSTAEGCQLLLDQWEGLRNFLIREREKSNDFLLPDDHLVGDCRIVRLLGCRDPEARILAAGDRRLQALLRVQEMALDQMAREILEIGSEKDDQAFASAYPRMPPDVPDPAEVQRLNEQLWILVDETWRKLEAERDRRAEEEAAAETTDEEAAFDDSPEGERLHRYQTQWSRTLRRTLDEIQRQHDRTEEPPQTPPKSPRLPAPASFPPPCVPASAPTTSPAPMSPPAKVVGRESVAVQGVSLAESFGARSPLPRHRDAAPAPRSTPALPSLAASAFAVAPIKKSVKRSQRRADAPRGRRRETGGSARGELPRRRPDVSDGAGKPRFLDR